MEETRGMGKGTDNEMAVVDSAIAKEAAIKVVEIAIQDHQDRGASRTKQRESKRAEDEKHPIHIDLNRYFYLFLILYKISRKKYHNIDTFLFTISYSFNPYFQSFLR